eukprot:TRINITY_DN37172_c0_g1_i1.p1 TRINITY_DN37172_c0_g1~~TRINITY_DN37172_c0_g1_i1.p1  ORF type:complete len:204 (-),score=27.76 TRINITY_DN37172_c0_g1_i1:655-1266(-)
MVTSRGAGGLLGFILCVTILGFGTVQLRIGLFVQKTPTLSTEAASAASVEGIRGNPALEASQQVAQKAFAEESRGDEVKKGPAEGVPVDEAQAQYYPAPSTTPPPSNGTAAGKKPAKCRGFKPITMWQANSASAKCKGGKTFGCDGPRQAVWVKDGCSGVFVVNDKSTMCTSRKDGKTQCPAGSFPKRADNCRLMILTTFFTT